MFLMCVFLTFNTFPQQAEIVKIGGRPPQTYRAPEYIPDEANGDVCLQNVPRYDWSEGCFNTAAAMLVGYYDWKGWDDMYAGPSAINGLAPQSNIEYWGTGNCPLSATEKGMDGRLYRGHVDNYWGDPDPYIVNGWPQHTWKDCTGDFMGTSQDYWNMPDGFTAIAWLPNGEKVHNSTQHENSTPRYKDGCHGLRKFIESRGPDQQKYTVLQNYNQAVKKGNMTMGFTFDDYKNEINDDRPVFLHVTQHTMLGIGYNNNGNKVILLDTWDWNTHEMTWAGTYWDGFQYLDHYAVTVIEIADPPPPAADDFVEFVYDPPNFVPPVVLDLDNWYQYVTKFTSVQQNSHVIWWKLSIELYHENGQYQLFYEEENTPYIFEKAWYVNTPAELPQYTWIRNSNGNIDGFAKVEVMDSDGFYHFDQLDIEFLFGPPTPQIVGASVQNNSLFLSYVTMGAPEYEIYYDIDPGPPYNGTGALQGNSPIDAGGLTTFEISGLQTCTPYYFSIKATNDQGQSVFSPEKEIVIIESANQNIQYVFDEYYMNYNTTLDDNYYFDGDLIIGSGVSVTIGGINTFGENSKIIIQPGGKLTLDGAICTGVCDQTWQGIEVWGDKNEAQLPDENGNYPQGFLEMKNGAIVENSLMGIELWKPGDYNTTGGIIDAKDAIFRNNKKSIHALNYRNIYDPEGLNIELNYYGRFEDCTFEITSTYHGEAEFFKHIDLSQVKGFRFDGCDFSVDASATNVSQWTAGIAAYDAGFTAEARCTSNNTPCSEWDPVTFDGFNNGISVSNTGSNNTFSVYRAQFTNNATGIRASGVNNFSVLFSDFFIGENNTDGTECEGQGGRASGIGISTTSGNSFAIEENYFTKAAGAPTGNYTGIRVAETNAVDEIYNNQFNGLGYGIYAEGKNWEGSDFSKGLSLLCNQFTGSYRDIDVEKNIPGQGGIQSSQGSAARPAGNEFVNTDDYTIYNNGNYPILYYYTTGTTTADPDPSWEVGPMPTGNTNNCPSHYGGGSTEGLVLSEEESLAVEQEYLAATNNYNNVKALYNNLQDGGDTEGLKAEVETAWPTDTWELRAELLGKSPHLSTEVLKKAADKTEVLPESILFEILSANPDELRKEELIKYLEDKENPLPQYMIDILRQVAYGTTYKTALQNQMAESLRLKTRAANDIIRSILYKEETDFDELRNWLDNRGGITADQQIIESYLAEGNVDDALSLAGMIPQLYQLCTYDLDEHDYYLDMLNLRIDVLQQGRNYDELTGGEVAQLESLAQNSYGTAGARARAILEQHYGHHYCNCLNVSGNQGFKSTTINPALLNQALGASITVDPNPARDWAAFDYSLPETADKGLIKISDASGNVVKVIEVTGTQGQYVWDTREVKPGVYFYTFLVNGSGNTSKLVISK